MNIKNLSIIRQSFANTVFTHKVHEIAAEKYELKCLKVKVFNIILVSLVLVMLVLGIIFEDIKIFTYIGSGLTVAEIIFLIIGLSFAFEEKFIMHKNSALKYMGLRDVYKILIVDVMNDSISLEQINSQRDLLQREYQIISDLSPQTSDNDYNKAQEKLNKKGVIKGEDFTWSDEEIDHFLPESLHISK